MKEGRLFHFTFTQITELKNVNSEIRSADRTSYLERYSPKGSCHLDESSMSHTLAQNCRCEFGCGMHLTCTNNPVTPDRNGSVKRPEKNQEATIATASAR